MSEPSANRTVLEVDGLVKHFPLKRGKGAVQAVNNVSLTINRGETLGLIGESGSGKTTVGRCILRLLDPTAGQITFGGRDISTLSQARVRSLRSRMQLVFQEPYDSLNPRARAAAIVEEPLRLAGVGADERHSRVEELFDLVQIDRSRMRSYPHQFTGGEQQRLGIARAIATEPDLVVLDEPTSALDVAVRAEILDLLAVLQQRLGVSYLFISHDLTAVRAISHRVAVMYLGRIVEEGNTSELFERQAHPYTQALLASVLVPTAEEALEPVHLRGEIPSPINLPTACHLHPRCPFAVDRCATDAPPLVPLEDGSARTVACWRADEVVERSAPVPVASVAWLLADGAAGPDATLRPSA